MGAAQVSIRATTDTDSTGPPTLPQCRCLTSATTHQPLLSTMSQLRHSADGRYRTLLMSLKCCTSLVRLSSQIADATTATYRAT